MGFRLQKFCCCCSLKTGSLVIGTAGWVFTLIELFIFVQIVVESSGPSSYHAIDETEPNEYTNALNISHRRQIFTQIGYGIVSFLICVLLIIGVYRKDKRFILPWLVLKAGEGVLTILLTIISFLAAFAFQLFQPFFFVMTFGLGIMTVILWYCWLCVYSHYRELREEPSDTAPPIYYHPAPEAPPPTYVEAEKTKFSLA